MEVFGHRQYVGRYEEVTRFGAAFCRIWPRKSDGTEGEPVDLAGSSFFSFREISKERALEYAGVRPAVALPLPSGCWDDEEHPDDYEDDDRTEGSGDDPVYEFLASCANNEEMKEHGDALTYGEVMARGAHDALRACPHAIADLESLGISFVRIIGELFDMLPQQLEQLGIYEAPKAKAADAAPAGEDIPC